MTTIEELQQQAADSGVKVINWNFDSDRIKGLYCDGMIAMNDRIETSAEEASILAEELGHHLTASGNILDQRNTANRKQEMKGRIWAYNRLIGLAGIIKAYKAGCRNRYEVAELLGVSEDMLQEALSYYREKYGLFAQVDNYTIYFEPLGIMELM